jgi:hypothetical protein
VRETFLVVLDLSWTCLEFCVKCVGCFVLCNVLSRMTTVEHLILSCWLFFGCLSRESVSIASRSRSVDDAYLSYLVASDHQNHLSVVIFQLEPLRTPSIRTPRCLFGSLL